MIVIRNKEFSSKEEEKVSDKKAAIGHGVWAGINSAAGTHLMMKAIKKKSLGKGLLAVGAGTNAAYHAYKAGKYLKNKEKK